MKGRILWRSRLHPMDVNPSSEFLTLISILSLHDISKTNFMPFSRMTSVSRTPYVALIFFTLSSPKSWFSRLSLPRDQITTFCRIRSNHYNLNYSLHRKNIVASAACQCGDPRQDINHVIFRCPLTRLKSRKLIAYLRHCDPYNNLDLFSFLKSPRLKFCYLL